MKSKRRRIETEVKIQTLEDFDRIMINITMIKEKIDQTNKLIDSVRPFQTNEQLDRLFENLTQLEPSFLETMLQIEDDDLI